jgi:hypothetical protein
MNRIMREHYPLFRMYQSLRDQMMGLLSEADLAFTPGSPNPPLGDLCREMGEVQQAYIESFSSWAFSHSYHGSAPASADSLAGLIAWYAELDQRLEAAVAALSDEDLASKVVDRGPNFKIPAFVQLEIYKEALLIFYGKSSVYLKLLGKPLSQQWQDWIA